MRSRRSRRRMMTGVLATLITASGLMVALPQGYADPPAGPNPEPALVPKPVSWTGGTGSLALTTKSRIVIDPDQLDAVTTGPSSSVLVGQKLIDVANELRSDLAAEGLSLRAVTQGRGEPPAGPGDIALGLSGTSDGVEGYDLSVGTEVTINASTTTGAYWATRTLLQELRQSVDGRTLPRGTVHDEPSLPMRTYMLDMARKYWQPSYIYDLIRQMSYLKMNVLQMHFDDAEGFRLNSPNYPGLADPASSYNQAQIKAFVAFGRQHNVQIMPGFELPGHATATDEYFKIGLGDGPDPCPQSSVYGWVTPDWVMDITKPESLQVVTGMLQTFVPWFSAPWVHVGADELPASIATCPRIADYLSQHPQYGGWDGLFNTFLNNVDDVLHRQGKQMAVYTGFSTTAAVTVNHDVLATDWTGAGGTLAGYPVIDENSSAYLTPNNYHHLYPDTNFLYSQWTPDNDGGTATLGGAISVWDDYLYWAQDAYFEGLAAFPRAVVADRTWNTALPSDTITDFQQAVQQVGQAPGFVGFATPKPVTGDRPVHDWTFEPAPRPAGYPLSAPVATGYIQYYKDYAGDLNGSSYIISSPTTVPGVQGSGIHSTGVPRSGIGLGGVDLAGPWTLSLWVRPTGTLTTGTLLASPNGNEIRLQQTGTGQVGLTYNGTNYSFNYTAPMSVWTQLTFRNDGSGTTLYVNGIPQQTLPVSMPLPLAAFGSRNTFVNADLDNVAVYDHALTDTQIAQNLHTTS